MRKRGMLMNKLSTEVKAKEIHEKAVGYFKVSEQYGYKFIMEVKKIRDDRYYKELGFSSFDDYCNEAWGVGRRVIDERIQSASSLSKGYFESYNSQFGHRKTFLLATMEDEQREQAIDKGIPTNEGYKTISEATQKEINEYKRNAEEAEERARQAELQVEQARQSEKIAQKKLEEELNKEPEVIEKVIEDTSKVNRLEQELKSMKQRLERESQDAQTYRELKRDIDKLESEKSQVLRQINNVSSIGKFISRVERSFEEDLAPVKYSDAISELSNSEVAVESLEKIVSKVENWCEEIRGLMRDRNIVEVIDYEEK